MITFKEALAKFNPNHDPGSGRFSSGGGGGASGKPSKVMSADAMRDYDMKITMDLQGAFRRNSSHPLVQSAKQKLMRARAERTAGNLAAAQPHYDNAVCDFNRYLRGDKK